MALGSMACAVRRGAPLDWYPQAPIHSIPDSANRAHAIRGLGDFLTSNQVK
jgi:hypothetical protein